MPALTAAEREFLRLEWRWHEISDPLVKSRFSGAREAEYPSFWITLAGATAALNIIHAATSGDNKLVVATIDVALTVSFKTRPRTVRVLTSRYGNNAVTGRDMICERATVDHGGKRTTLYLTG